MSKIELEVTKTIHISLPENEAVLLYSAMTAAILTGLSGSERAMFKRLREDLGEINFS